MRAAIWLTLLFAAAVVAALTLGSNDGLASFYWRGWRMDLSLNFFLLLVIVACFALVTLINAIDGLISLPRRAQAWRTAQRERGAQLALRESFAEYFGGRYGRAQKAAQRALAINAQTTELNADAGFAALAHLLTAQSAHRLQDRRRRDEQLSAALESAKLSGQARPTEEGARLLAAEWALDDRDSARALRMLGELGPGPSRRTQALRLKLQATRMASQPVEAMRTARLLAKHQGFSKLAAQGLLRSLANEAIEAVRDIDQLRRVWQQFDAADRRDALIAARAAQAAAAMGAMDDARGWLRPFWDALDELGSDERAALAESLVLCMPGIGPEWLQRLESAQTRFPREVHFSYVLGQALRERQLWGKARAVLEQVADERELKAAARRRCWLALAELATQDGDEERRARCFEAAARIP